MFLLIPSLLHPWRLLLVCSCLTESSYKVKTSTVYLKVVTTRKAKKVLETILNLKNRQRRCHVKSIIDFWVDGNEVGTSKYFMEQNFMPMSSEFNYDTGEKRIVKTLKLHFVSYIFMNIFIDLSMVIYQIVDKDRIWLTN